MDKPKKVILDDSDEPDYSPEMQEAFRRRTAAGEDPVAVAKDLNRHRFNRDDD